MENVKSTNKKNSFPALNLTTKVKVEEIRPDDPILEEDSFLLDGSVVLENMESSDENIDLVTKLETDLIDYKEKRYQCCSCVKSFKRASQLKAHKQLHLSRVEDLFCDICQQSFSTRGQLSRHSREEHRRQFHCTECTHTFNSLRGFKAHTSAHCAGGGRPFKCPDCNVSFVHQSYLRVHRRTHTGEKPFQCSMCQQAFKQVSHLTTHVRTHTNDRPFVCSLCGAAFTQSSSLKRHSRSHTGEKPFRCDECGALFVEGRNLLRHKLTHTGERPFKCGLCNAAFSQMIDLKRHGNAHAGLRPFVCETCDAAFSRKHNLNWHKLTHKGDTPFSCDVCPAAFNVLRELKTHRRVHMDTKPFRCEQCPAAFTMPASLRRHQFKHSCMPQTFACAFCASAFHDQLALRRHIHRHEIQEPRKCNKCNATFLELRSLKRHRVLVHGEERFGEEPTAGGETGDAQQEVIIGDPPYSSGTNNSQAVVAVSDDSNKMLESHGQEPIVAQLPLLDNNVVSDEERMQSPNDVPISPDNIQMPNMPVVSEIVTFSGQANLPTLLLTQPGHPPKTARPANNCMNHQAHVLTYIDGSYNQWQSWCFCETPNIPEGAVESTVLESMPPVQSIPVSGADLIEVMSDNRCQQFVSSEYGADFDRVIEYDNTDTSTNQVKEVTESDQVGSNGATIFTQKDQLISPESELQVQYSLTVNNPAAGGDIQIQSDAFQASLPPSSPNESTFTIKPPRLKRKRNPSSNDAVEPAKLYMCTVCDKTFSRINHMMIHQRTHTGERPFQCGVCLQTFAHKNSLTIHMRGHTGERPFQCTLCLSAFTQRSNLAVHMRTHTGLRPHSCDVCAASFSQGSHLKAHMRIHNNDRPYICNVCAQGFTQRSAMKRHMRTHTRKLPFKCDECQACFAHKGELKRHAAAHAINQTSMCMDCDTVFNDDKELDQHRLEVHSGDTFQVKFPKKGKQKMVKEPMKDKNDQLTQSKLPKRKAVTLTPIRISQRIKEAAIKVKKESDFITGDFDDLNDDDKLTETKTLLSSGSVKKGGKDLSGKTNGNATLGQASELKSKQMENWCFCEIPHGPDEPHTNHIAQQPSGKVVVTRVKQEENLGGLNENQLPPSTVGDCQTSQITSLLNEDEITNGVSHMIGAGELVTHEGTIYFDSGEVLDNGTVILNSTAGTYVSYDGMSFNSGDQVVDSSNNSLDPLLLPVASSSSGGVTYTSFPGGGSGGQMLQIVKVGTQLEGETEASFVSRIENCSVCGHMFAEMRTLIEHVRLSHPESSVCGECGAAFATQDQLTCHAVEHQKLLMCHCGMVFAKRGALSRHRLEAHSGVTAEGDPLPPPSVVTAINKMASNSSRTLTTTEEEKPFSCTECHMRFLQQCDLRRHMLGHTGEKPFHCGVCQVGFTRVSSLNKHARIHTGEKPYVCNVCNKAFTYRYQFNRHKTVHENTVNTVV